MRKLSLFCLLMSCIGLQSCKNFESNTDKVIEADGAKVVSVQCYKALYESDTIDLKINTLKNNKISGNMIMKIENMPIKTGEIEGEFHGDTLFVDYSFIQGTNEKKTRKNPMALLKKGEELIMGNGKMETTLGQTYFIKNSPIDFDRVKYKFTSVDCVD
ncbi:hypothetical protein [Flavobacterium sp. K5-23]|uniref:hypothetical protein n=1 Tax=Flavobacterium sp. K5-23 TaxID=2746225 RepID=UPI00200D0732|nr:hypothetical protein [Flavobacterium sp. K5-23]UQD56359.1 hypothetical protein FLAK523_08175 [Flavobacterium sp. K5-23]